ncbi:hypothetical protein CEE36_05725 [candidate division TA06 bacterium B3_TA06]|uniref:Uncharacterized protein n=1 Tax=candidate division TA06 bacterium B3_TA06 TaxID=2012487 RepID=A0A532V703_UNCT6|nr:MAG: hypothetical protein CEE36_05725 [candidate division TA06 bacterium B3_TA06]
MGEGIEHHRRKRYIESVLLFLPHVEAILLDYLDDRKLLNEIRQKKQKLQWRDTIGPLEEMELESLVNEITKSYLIQTALKEICKFSDEINPPFPNRDKILHGISLEYDTEENSAKLIYLLDAICEITQAEINEIKGNPKGP